MNPTNSQRVTLNMQTRGFPVISTNVTHSASWIYSVLIMIRLGACSNKLKDSLLTGESGILHSAPEPLSHQTHPVSIYWQVLLNQAEAYSYITQARELCQKVSKLKSTQSIFMSCYPLNKCSQMSRMINWKIRGKVGEWCDFSHGISTGGNFWKQWKQQHIATAAGFWKGKRQGSGHL